MLNATEGKVTWEEQKSKRKKRFAILTENDLLFREGRKDEMLDRIQLTLGKTKEELRSIITAL